jgi:PAS domain-containing protein
MERRHPAADAQSILELAARSMFQLFSSVSQGMFLVDRSGRIVWVNEGYQRFLPDLGFHRWTSSSATWSKT